MFFHYKNRIIKGDSTTERNVVIPSELDGVTITEIGPSCFFGCDIIESVFIPKTIKEIKYNAFCKCKNLKEVVFEEDSDIETIDMNAFLCCENLEKISINSHPDVDILIGSQCFKGTKIKFLDLSNTGIKTVRSMAFYQSKIEKIVFPTHGIDIIEESAFSGSCISEELFKQLHIRSIPSNAFSNCFNIKSIPYEWISKMDYIGVNAFTSCGISGELKLPSKNIYDIACFSNNPYIKRVEFIDMEDDFSIIRDMFLYNCRLQDVRFPENLISVKPNAFKGCALTEILFSQKIKFISESAFENCNLTSINLAKTNIEGIASFAFYNNNIKELILNPFIISLGKGVFGKNPIKSYKNAVFCEINETAFYSRSKCKTLV